MCKNSWSHQKRKGTTFIASPISLHMFVEIAYIDLSGRACLCDYIYFQKMVDNSLTLNQTLSRL